MAEPRQIWEAVLGRVSDFTRVRKDALVAGGQALACITHARMLAVYIAVVEIGLSHRELARASGVDQPTVSHAVRTIEERRDDPALDAAIDAMASALRRELGVRIEPGAAANDDAGELIAH